MVVISTQLYRATLTEQPKKQRTWHPSIRDPQRRKWLPYPTLTSAKGQLETKAVTSWIRKLLLAYPTQSLISPVSPWFSTTLINPVPPGKSRNLLNRVPPRGIQNIQPKTSALTTHTMAFKFQSKLGEDATRDPTRPSIPGVRAHGRGPVEQYGCVRWSPEELPSGETEESLLEMKREMQQLYAQVGMAGAERGALQRWHEMTYILQRHELNADPSYSISKIKDDWPFLFSQKGLFSHFSELTGISILEKLPVAIDQRSQTIMDYCQQQKTPGVGKVLEAYQEENGNKAICIILCLLAHFKEDGIFLTADPSATAADIQRAITLPSPRLLAQGETLSTDMWLMSMEGTCVMGPHSNLLNGVAALFTAYYVFNLQYPAEASSTLEFIQRAFCGINPLTGSKAEKKRGLNAPVCTLLRKLLDFELMGKYVFVRLLGGVASIFVY
uniref:uncharacterized protein LOC117262495 n=1 Tax=Epinephelus lanceolatus TaxID=310571 RepID=UPI001446B520|nr:uncharacterized protein LOC117262495 [Epinephelus lanceolatus]